MERRAFSIKSSRHEVKKKSFSSTWIRKGEKGRGMEGGGEGEGRDR